MKTIKVGGVEVILPKKPVSGAPIPWDDKDVSKRVDPRDWAVFQQGNADGIVCLDDLSNRVEQNGVSFNQILAHGTQRQAIPYLRPCDPKWQARNPGKRGHTFPMDWRQLFYGQHAMALADECSRETQQPLLCILMADIRAAHDCVQPAYCRKWVLECTETEGVWAVFFDPLRV